MPDTATASRSLAAGLMGLGLAWASPAAAQGAATDYDGAWQFVLTCSANTTTRAPAFTERFPAAIEQGQFTRTRTVRATEGPDIVDRMRGTVQNGRMTVVVESARGVQRWATRLEGAAASPTRFDLTGGVFLADNRKVRDCTMTGTLQRPAAQSLAAAAATRPAAGQRAAAAIGERLAAVEAALAAALAAATQAEARGDLLQTELDLARFEGNTVRAQAAELAQAAQQQVAALTARASQAEGALAAARAEAAQVVQAAQQQVAALTARASQAEGALAAARAEAAQVVQAAQQQVAALTARASQAEGALAAARAEAAQVVQAAQQQVAALTARATQAEAAAAAARAEAAQSGGRVSQLEAALAALRGELEQARRTLAEREAAAPRQ